MEYYHPVVGTIVQSTGWVQCTHVHVVQGHQHGLFIYNITRMYTFTRMIQTLLMGLKGRRYQGTHWSLCVGLVHLQDSGQHHTYHYYLIIKLLCQIHFL